MTTADTSVVVAAALTWHEDHATARSLLRGARPRLPGQVVVETYSVLTRLPPSLRLSGRAAWDYLTRRFEWPPFVLPADAHNGLLEGAAAEGIVGGAVYDALVGATAREAGATLLTLDRRATTTYEVVGVDFRFAG